MDKEDYTDVLLSVLQKPQWKRSSSVTDWDLKAILRRAGSLATPGQMSALLYEIRKRGLIAGQEDRHDGGGVGMWGIRITPAGEEWLADRGRTVPGAPCPAPDSPPAQSERLDLPAGGDPAPRDSGQA